MKTSLLLVSAVLGAAVALGAGCASPREGAVSASAESELRKLEANEILGPIGYGETKEVELTPSPVYRAFSFEGVKGDIIEARASSLDATDPVLWLTDESFTTLALSTDSSATDLGATIRNRTLGKTGTYYLVFREMNRAPRAKFAVSVKKTAAVPESCDPDGEGVVDPSCTEPLGFDPFDPGSCNGPELTAADAAAKFPAAGLALQDSKIYYRTRQCTLDRSGGASCSPWVRSFVMDIGIARANPSPTTPGAYLFAATPSATATTGRVKVKVEFSPEPSTLKAFCVDGPFTALRNTGDWARFDDGTGGVCGFKPASTPVVTATCARFEPATIQLNAGDDARYTEYGAVLVARY